MSDDANFGSEVKIPENMAMPMLADEMSAAEATMPADPILPVLPTANNNTGEMANGGVAANTEKKSKGKKSFLIVVLVLILLLLVGGGVYALFNFFSISRNEEGSSLTKNFSLDLDNLTDMESFTERPFSSQARELLTQQGFVIRPTTEVFYDNDPEMGANRSDDWTGLYGTFGGGPIQGRRPANSILITSDFLLHIYHRLFDLQLKYLEITSFSGKLADLTQRLFDYSAVQVAQANEDEQRTSWERLTTFLAVALAQYDESLFATRSEYDSTPVGIFEAEANKDNVMAKLIDDLCGVMTSEACAMAQTELTAVLAADDVKTSTLFAMTGIDVDYTQFTPRGHYSDNAILQNYFRMMMWFGRSNFILNGENEEANRVLTLDALNLAYAIDQVDGLGLYQQIKEPIDYLVGENDDLSVEEYLATLGNRVPSSELAQSLQADLLAQSKQRIMSEIIRSESVIEMTEEELAEQTVGFHFFSQKFTPDALVFSSLTQGDTLPDPETGERLPSLPTALMVPAAFGNQEAEEQLKGWMVASAENSQKVLAKEMEKLQDYYRSWTASDWQKNNYTRWLDTLNSLDEKPAAQEVFQTAVWQKKQLNAYLGSYTELKHDTLLYAKQSYAEAGGGADGDIPDVPKGYIEPNLAFMNKLREMVFYNQKMLIDKELIGIDSELAGRYDLLLENVDFYTTLVKQEIAGEEISEEDFEELRTSGGRLGHVISTIFPIETLEKDVRSALVADVFTDGVGEQILYQANAIPDQIFAIVDDANGRRLVRGLTYSYREFTEPLGGQRLNDQNWQSRVYQLGVNLPAQPSWYQPLMVAE